MSIGLIRRFLGPTKNNEKNQENQPTTVKILYLGHKMYVGLIRRLLDSTLLIQIDAASRTKSSAPYKPFYPYRRK